MVLVDAGMGWSPDGPKKESGLAHKETGFLCSPKKSSPACRKSAGHDCLPDAPLERETTICEPFVGITNFAYSIFLMFAGNEGVRYGNHKEQHVRFEGDATLRASPTVATTSSSSLGSSTSIRDVSDSTAESQYSCTRVTEGVDLCDADAPRNIALPSESGDVRRQLEADLNDGNPHSSGRGGAGSPVPQQASSGMLAADQIARGIEGRKQRGGDTERPGVRETVALPRLDSFTAETYVRTSELCDREAQRTDNFSEVKFKDLSVRTPNAVAPASTFARPNYSDMLKRVSVVIYKHLKTCEANYERMLQARQKMSKDEFADDLRAGHDIKEGRFDEAMAGYFHEREFIPLKFRYGFFDAPPMATGGLVYTLHEQGKRYKKPTVEEIHEFAKTIFTVAHLSSECSLVCLIYIERAMERAGVPVLASTWRPLLISGLTMASKMWMDYAMYTRELSNAFPEFEFDKLVGLELRFLQTLKWELGISRTEYARYYFSLRTLNGDIHCRRRYERLLKVSAPSVSETSKGTTNKESKKSETKRKPKGSKLSVLSRSI